MDSQHAHQQRRTERGLHRNGKLDLHHRLHLRPRRPVAFYIDLRKIRKIQKAQEAKARNLTKTERRELDDAIAASIERDQQRRAERKGKMPWSKKKPEADSGETPDES